MNKDNNMSILKEDNNEITLEEALEHNLTSENPTSTSKLEKINRIITEKIQKISDNITVIPDKKGIKVGFSDRKHRVDIGIEYDGKDLCYIDIKAPVTDVSKNRCNSMKNLLGEAIFIAKEHSQVIYIQLNFIPLFSFKGKERKKDMKPEDIHEKGKKRKKEKKRFNETIFNNLFLWYPEDIRENCKLINIYYDFDFDEKENKATVTKIEKVDDIDGIDLLVKIIKNSIQKK